jgi:hypothetical protein
MKYLLLIYNDEAAAAAAMANTPPEEQAAQLQPWYDYGDWLTEKGWFVTGDALQPTSTATSVRMADAKPVVTDGPFAETKEQLGGYYILDVANLDEAIEAGARCPGVPGPTAGLKHARSQRGRRPPVPP